jgi:hypothetical protein
MRGFLADLHSDGGVCMRRMLLVLATGYTRCEIRGYAYHGLSGLLAVTSVGRAKPG